MSCFIHMWMLYFSALKVMGEECKSQDYKDTFYNQMLINHVFKTEFASSDGHCESKCFMDDKCISYNFGHLVDLNPPNLCQLSYSDHVMHPNDLIGRNGTVYRRAENSCNCSPFKICRVNWLKGSFVCECKEGFAGDKCDTAITTSSPSPTTSSLSPTTSSPSPSSLFDSALSGKGDWETARDACEDKNKRLPVILSATDNLAAYTKLWENGGKTDMWIGLGKNTAGLIVWLDGKEPTYTNWDVDPGTGGCAKMVYSGTWKLVPCNYNLLYHCV